MDVDPRLFRPLVTLADQRHFGRAAQVLGVSQPALTQQINRLETQLGVRLFERTSRRVELTEDGERLATDARDALERLDRAVAAARGRGRARPARLGMTPDAPPALVAALKSALTGRRAPQVVVSRPWAAELVDDVRSARLDVGVGRRLLRDRALTYRHLADEPAQVIVGARHPLAGAAAVALAELAEFPLVLAPRTVAPGEHEFARAACRAAGFDPRVRVRSVSEAPELAAAATDLHDDAFRLGPRSAHLPVGAVSITLRDPLTFPLTLVTPGAMTEGAREVAALLVEAARNEPAPRG
jgi:DNA-binding transcriptional LysR family regulator